MKIALIAAAGLIFTSTATANETESGWITNEFEQSVDVKGSATEDYVYSGVITQTANPNEPGVRFSCSERNGLRVTLETVPASERVKASRGRPALKKSLLSIDDREPVRTQWLLVKKTQTLQARRNKTAAMIYNAIASGKGFSVRVPMGGGTVRFDPPKADENFKAFVETCVKTNGS